MYEGHIGNHIEKRAKRIITVGLIGKIVCIVVYTIKKNAVRIISAGKVNERERKEYFMKGSKLQRLEKIENVQDNAIDYSGIPGLDDSFWYNAKIIYQENKKPVI